MECEGEREEDNKDKSEEKKLKENITILRDRQEDEI